MGYTHYMTNCSNFSTKKWYEFCNKAEYIFENANVPIVFEINNEFININGVDDDGCENLIIEKKNNKNFIFCKTERKPYDIVICAILILLDDIKKYNINIKITSDGNLSDGWQDAYDFYIKLFGCRYSCMKSKLYKYISKN